MTHSSGWLAFKSSSARIWALTKPYFQSEQKWKARGLLLAIVLLNLGAVYMLVQINEWNRVFYDALQDKRADVFWAQLWRFCWLAGAFIVIAVYRFYLTQLLELRWREWMTAHYLRRWLSHDAFYRMELARYTPAAPDGDAATIAPDNPDQRIQEDLFLFTRYSVSLSMGLLNAVVTLVSFVGILWGLSGSFSFELFGASHTVPGAMVWLAVLYCAAGSLATYYIGRPQIALNYRQQRFEADFRHHMTRVREYSEAIALDRGAGVEREQLDSRFSTVLANYLRLIKAQKNLVWFTAFFGQAAVVFPFIVAAPRYFSGAIQLGVLMQIASAFGRVQDSLSWFVDNYPDLAAWRATSDRLTNFEAALAAQSGALAAAPRTQSADGAVAMRDVTLALPDGAPLLHHLAFSVRPGDRVLVEGPSGSGKSTLFRAIAGIWPFARGEVALPAGFEQQAMFIPQHPYFPNGPLRDALAYPHAPGAYGDAELRQALSDALLPQLANRLDDEDAWSQKLSGGEQQRLALARVLLRKPKWIFADEATSALDEAAEQTLHQRLLALVKASGGALVSIAHRPSVAAFHDRRWPIARAQADTSSAGRPEPAADQLPG